MLTGTGPFTLTDAGNDVTTLAAGTGETGQDRDANTLTVGSVTVLGVTTTGITTTDDDVQLQTGTTLLIDDDIALGNGDLGINAASGVTQNGGDTITAAGLALKGTVCSQLTDAGNDVTTLAASTGETVSYRDANALTVGSVTVLGVTTTGITTTNDDVQLQTGTTLWIDDDIALGNGIWGSTRQAVSRRTAGDTITAAGLCADGAGLFTLTDAGNDVTMLAAGTGETVSYRDANALTVGSVMVLGVTTTGITTSDDVLVATGGTLTVGTPITSQVPDGAVGGSITLRADGDVVIQQDVTTNGGQRSGPFVDQGVILVDAGGKISLASGVTISTGSGQMQGASSPDGQTPTPPPISVRLVPVDQGGSNVDSQGYAIVEVTVNDPTSPIIRSRSTGRMVTTSGRGPTW